VLSKNAIYLLQQRYCRQGESPEGVFKRVAETLGQGDTKFEERLFDVMVSGIFLPNSPCLFNAGLSKGSLHACYTLKIQDDLASIFEAVTNMARIFKSGGGVGINFSTLREKGARLSGGGTSSGVLSFMGLFDRTVDTVKQGGRRRGALMGILDYSHPEIFDFIKIKLEGKLQNFNLSIMVNDEFMKSIDTNKKIQLKSPMGDKNVIETVKIKDIFELVCFAAWCNGDPAFLFFDRINRDNPYYPEVVINTVNPCLTGDTLIAVADGRNAVSIKQLAEERKDIPVYCKDLNKRTTIIRMMRNIRKTGCRKKILKVNLDDGSYIKCTENHRFLLSSLKYKEASDLQPNDSLFRFQSYYNNGYRQIQNLRRSRRQYRMIYEFYHEAVNPKFERIHHEDFNKLNDLIENLKKCTKEEHNKIHDISGDKNPINKLKLWGKFEEWKKRNPAFDVAGEKNPMWGKHFSESSKEKMRKSGYHSNLKEINNPFYGKHHTEFAKQKISESRKSRIFNHKVVSVELCGYEDVYDGNVDEFHNFGIITSFADEKYVDSSGVFVHNCSEVALPNQAACCLGSINLSKFVWKNEFNFDKFEDICRVGMRALASMNKVSVYPLEEIKQTMEKYNPVGLGIMGFADLLIKLGIKYDSQDCLDFIDKLGAVYKKATEEYDKDTFYFYRRIIAPTGSLSILADCSSGIEPIYDTTFERRLAVGVVEETRDLYKSEHVRTAYQVSPEWHVKVLAQWQKWVNGGVSKTVNLPHDASLDDIKDVYRLAWKMNCKGVTVFRDGCRNDQVLVTKTNKFNMGKCSDDTCTL